jgi:hypothetical protein
MYHKNIASEYGLLKFLAGTTAVSAIVSLIFLMMSIFGDSNINEYSNSINDSFELSDTTVSILFAIISYFAGKGTRSVYKDIVFRDGKRNR